MTHQSDGFAMRQGLMDSHWCIVVADDAGPEWRAEGLRAYRPVQYARIGESATLLQRALNRAAALAPAAQVVLTAAEEHRAEWEPFSWFVRSDRRYICENRAAAPLTLAAGLLSIAARSVSNIVTILPSRCVVADEGVLLRTLSCALDELPQVPEGIVSLGMLDLEEGVDEDYLVVAKSRSGPGLQVQGYARRPVPWVARHLRAHGALVASGILIGYAGAFACHLSRRWPGLAARLHGLMSVAARSRDECVVPLDSLHGITPGLLSSLRWQPPNLPMRVFGVARCGWCGLKSARAVARHAGFVEQLAACTVASKAARDPDAHAVAMSFHAGSHASGDCMFIQDPLGSST
jgi:hypothetical protein